MRCTRFQRGQRVDHSKTNIIVRMNSEPRTKFVPRHLGDANDFFRKPTTVRVTKDNDVYPNPFRSLPCGQDVLWFIPVTIEAVLSIKEHDFPMIFEKTNHLTDHDQILIKNG